MSSLYGSNEKYELIPLYGLMKLAQTIKRNALTKYAYTACEVLHPSITASTQISAIYQPEGLKMFMSQKEVSMVIGFVISLRTACYYANALQWV